MLLASCTSDDGREPESALPSPGDGSAASAHVRVLRTITQGLNTPWGLALLPDGDALVSSRDEGTISRVDADSGDKTEAGTVPGVAAQGEGGLLGLTVSPDFSSDRLVYAYLTSTSDNRIVRKRYDASQPSGEQMGQPETVLDGIPSGTYHNGGRIAFGPDGTLYAGTGEAYDDPERSQDRDSLGGKILRMTPEGQPARGNPDPDSVVYSYGHRNVQGLAWDEDDRLWASEFGQDTWDELNLVRPGRNYGWPEVEGRSSRAGFVDPLAQWTTAEASPSGVAYVDGALWMAGLRGERLWRIPLDGARASGKPQAVLEGE